MRPPKPTPARPSIAPVIAIFVAAAALAVVASVWVAPGARGMLGAGLAVIATAIAAVDLRRYVIPDEFVLAGVVLALVQAAALSDEPVAAMALAIARGGLLAGLFFLLRATYARVRGREGIGLGDVKLAAMAGAWLEIASVPFAVATAALAALAVIAVRQRLLGRSLRAASRVPFGAFFAPAIWLAWFVEAALLYPS
jgi:leader peptidase (prepilin peptidase)/N-methyltransferase